MLENLRRKSLVKTYHDPRYSINFEQGHVIHREYISVGYQKQKLSKKGTKKNFQSTFDGVSKEFRLIAHTYISDTYNDVEFNMIFCPSGTFTMGHDKDESGNKPRLETIERPFLLGETEVTQQLYQAVMGENPSKSSPSYLAPVEMVSWYDAILFCNKLSKLQGFNECYVLTDISTIDKNGVDQKRIMSAKVTCDFDKNGYRLPKEKEWEYAAKAGTQNKYVGTDSKKQLSEYAWFGENWDRGSTYPVKKRKPNEWGFYDMSGNVKEWCWDRPYDSNHRVLRGGSYRNYSHFCKSTYRDSFDNYYASVAIGFRVCRSLFS